MMFQPGCGLHDLKPSGLLPARVRAFLDFIKPHLRDFMTASEGH